MRTILLLTALAACTEAGPDPVLRADLAPDDFFTDAPGARPGLRLTLAIECEDPDRSWRVRADIAPIAIATMEAGAAIIDRGEVRCGGGALAFHHYLQPSYDDRIATGHVAFVELGTNTATVVPLGPVSISTAVPPR